APGLASHYPKIKTYTGIGITDPRAHVRLDVTNFGFHAMVLSPRENIFIDPVSNESTEFYIVYDKKDLQREYEFNCGVKSEDENILNKRGEQQNYSADPRTSGTELRKYRLALACTGEYAATKGGTV